MKGILKQEKKKSYHLNVISNILEVVFAVFHGHLVVVLALRDVSHLSLRFVFQQQDGGRHQYTQNHLGTNTHYCECMLIFNDN